MEAKSKKDMASSIVKNIVSIDEGKIQSHVNGIVRSTVEETLNGLLDAEAERLCGASKYERTDTRKDSRAGHYDRKLQTQAGEVELVFDVAHNSDSAERLSQVLRNRPVAGVTRLVLAMLDDKDINGFTAVLGPLVDYWYLATLGGERGLTAHDLQERMCSPGAEKDIRCFQDVSGALRQAKAESGSGDRLVVCGSFVTVAEALACHV